MNIAVLLTVYNRIEKTIVCLDSLFRAKALVKDVHIHIYLTDDGSVDGTSVILSGIYDSAYLTLLQGTGNLYWSGGMIQSWQAAIKHGGYDGYLWLNNDCELNPNLFVELIEAQNHSLTTFGIGGIYVGTLTGRDMKNYTYGGFNFQDKWKLNISYVIPNGSFQNCMCAHGNVVYISSNVVSKEGVLHDKYLHSVADHDYIYRAYKHKIPLFVLRYYVGICENDHDMVGYSDFLEEMNFGDRVRFLKSPMGFNLRNVLLFQKRCFPHRYIFCLLTGFMKVVCPHFYLKIFVKHK